jgi:hypothetical protein
MKKIILISILSSLISGGLQSAHNVDPALQKILPVDKIQQLVLGYCSDHTENYSPITDTQSTISVSLNNHFYIASSSDERINIWQQRELLNWIKLLDGEASRIKSALYSIDGSCLAVGSYANKIKIWLLKNNTWKCIKTFDAHKTAITSVALSAQGDYIASASVDKEIKIWKRQDDNWECTHTLQHKDFACGSLIISSQGKSIAFHCLDNNQINMGQLGDDGIWYWASGQGAGDGTSIIYTSDDKTIFVSDICGRPLIKYTYTNNKWSMGVYGAIGSVSEDAYITTGFIDWSAKQNIVESLQSPIIPHRYESINKLGQDTTSAMRKRFPLEIQHLINSYGGDKWEKFQTLTKPTPMTLGRAWPLIAISPDDKYIFMVIDEVLQIWELKTESYELVQKIQLESRIEIMAVSSNNIHMAMKNVHGVVKRWQLKDEKWTYIDTIPDKSYSKTMIISPDGKKIAFRNNYDTQNSIVLCEFKDDTWTSKSGLINSGSFASSGTAYSNDNVLFAWDFGNNIKSNFYYSKQEGDWDPVKIMRSDIHEHVDTLRDHDCIKHAIFSESGNYIVTFTSYSIVNVWKNVKKILSSKQDR